MNAPHSTLASTDGTALPPCAVPFAAELRDIEAELDVLWPGYERVPFAMPVYGGGKVVLEGYKLRGRPFTVSGLPASPYRMEHVKRLKWLLKRHMLLMQGLDYGVVVAAGAGRQDGACFAHPTGERKPHPEPPPKVHPPSFAQPVQPETRSAAREALETGQPLEVVRSRPWKP